jgi:hypothetical protein
MKSKNLNPHNRNILIENSLIKFKPTFEKKCEGILKFTS